MMTILQKFQMIKQLAVVGSMHEAELSDQLNFLFICDDIEKELEYREPKAGIQQEITDFIFQRDFPTTVSVMVCPTCGHRYSQLDGDKACSQCGQVLKVGV